MRQKTIEFLTTHLGVPLNRLRVEETMTHVKKGQKVELILLFIEMMKKKNPLMVIECKAPDVDVSCDVVLEQAESYRKILKADYIMLVNGCNIIMYKYQDRKNLELVDISSYKASFRIKGRLY